MKKASILAILVALNATPAFPCSFGFRPDMRAFSVGEAFEATVVKYDKIVYPIPKFPTHEAARFELAITSNLDGKTVLARKITAYSMWSNFVVPAKWNGPFSVIVALHDQVEPDGRRVIELSDLSCGAPAIIQASEANRQIVRLVRTLKAKFGTDFWHETEPIPMP